MAASERLVSEFVFAFAEDADESNVVNAGAGCFGTVIVPTGSDLIGKGLQFVATSPVGTFADTELLSTPIELAAGSNPLSADQVAEVGAVKYLKLSIDAAVDEHSECVLLWKS